MSDIKIFQLILEKTIRAIIFLSSQNNLLTTFRANLLDRSLTEELLGHTGVDEASHLKLILLVRDAAQLVDRDMFRRAKLALLTATLHRFIYTLLLNDCLKHLLLLSDRIHSLLDSWACSRDLLIDLDFSSIAFSLKQALLLEHLPCRLQTFAISLSNKGLSEAIATHI